MDDKSKDSILFRFAECMKRSSGGSESGSGIFIWKSLPAMDSQFLINAGIPDLDNRISFVAKILTLLLFLVCEIVLHSGWEYVNFAGILKLNEGECHLVDFVGGCHIVCMLPNGFVSLRKLIGKLRTWSI